MSGLRLILIGLAKKVLIADNLAMIADAAYNSPQAHSGPALATYCFAFQIYCDFSGYSDIARGSVRLMGIELMTNFNHPYWSRTIREFWALWHISLSTWFRDYLYIPLGGNRVSPARHALNLMLVFVLSGLWHGANWTYVIWGALHGLFMIASVVRRRSYPSRAAPRSTVGNAVAIAVTFNLCAFAWIFFRANSLGDAWYIVTHLARGWGEIGPALTRFQIARQLLLCYAGLVAALLALELAAMHRKLPQLLARLPLPVRWTCYTAVLALIAFRGRFESRQFVYFQF